ncbi:MAG: endonuclease/exonuclease/phosphatase family protein [Anaeromyxobacteraceae bacterium]
MRSRSPSLAVALAAVAALAASACGNSSSEPSGLVAVSRNLYLGGDIFSIVTAGDATEAAVAVDRVWKSVVATNFPARAELVADELLALRPDVVGLQEVSLWRTGDPIVCAPDGSGLAVVTAPVASTVQYDYLATLLAALEARGLSYAVAKVTSSIDAEFCSYDPTGATAPFDLRYTDRDVILVRAGLATANAAGGLYATQVEFPIPGTPVVVPDPRAWNVVEVQKSGQWYRVFETHLEVQEIATPAGIPSYLFQLAQAGELVGLHVGPAQAARPMPTVVVGDFNTQAEEPPGSALRTTFDFVTGAIPFPDMGIPQLAPLVGLVSPLHDAWSTVNGPLPGLTWGFSADLATGTPTQRIDFAFFLAATPLEMATFGGFDRTPGTPPLHSSDHLGISLLVQP